jgi:hypothetical protein
MHSDDQDVSNSSLCKIVYTKTLCFSALFGVGIDLDFDLDKAPHDTKLVLNGKEK